MKDSKRAAKKRGATKSARRKSPKGEARPVEITRELLRAMPLPEPREADDKEARGRVLVVGGGPETPGAALLAGTAALRAGAGKLQVATYDPLHAATVGVALPEARVIPITFGPHSRMASLDECLRRADAVCVGPGWTSEREHGPLYKLLRVETRATLVFDSKAVAAYVNSPLKGAYKGRSILTPNAEESADLTPGRAKRGARELRDDARRAAKDLGAVVVLKGRETFICAPDGREYVNRAGNVGLATSGSGDVLAGLVAGLAARGADPLAAAVWGVHAHAVAGDVLARRVGALGFLARELLEVLPRVLEELAAGKAS
ncbi:MAG TPA: NAD(P)H-hydrate dehydratase [Pyrinomonadaceae bacterium]|nr:NAD(P)H-hydrate dehydratase [Pyrinomonadaceae bacterium]